MGAVTNSSFFVNWEKNMDLRQYFHKVKTLEASLPEDDQLVVSFENADGASEGRITEVSRRIAAKMIVEGRAVLATEEQKQQFMQKYVAARKAIEATEAARRVQVAIISDPDLISQLAGRKNSQQK
jgi:hypothetical protein